MVSEALSAEEVTTGHEHIRLLGIDAASLTPQQKIQAHTFVSNWIKEMDEVVALINKESLPSQEEADGRLPAWLMDSRTKVIMNVEMARRGLVHIRTEPYTGLFFSKAMDDAQQQARQSKLDIWGREVRRQ